MESIAGKTFLIVDDEEMLRDYFLEEFSDLGAHSYLAVRGTEISRDALRIVRQREQG